LCHFDKNEISNYLQDGDIICRLGNKFWSPILRDLSKNEKQFSHIGIVRIRDDTISVIHSEGLSKDKNDFVKKVTLECFLRGSRSIGVFRLKSIDQTKVSDIALDFIGRPFDWQFDMIDESSLYCTELLYVVLKRINPDIKLNTVWLNVLNQYVLPLDIVYQTEYFYFVGYWER